MALPYKVWTDEEVKSRNVIEDGSYPFKIKSAILKKTQSGIDKNGVIKPIRDMLEVEFEFFNINGNIRNIKDWIVFVETMDWKLRHLARALGLLDLYESKTLEPYHLSGKSGTFTLGSKEMVDRDGNKKKVNYIKDYIELVTEKNNDLNDEITF